MPLTGAPVTFLSNLACPQIAAESSSHTKLMTVSTTKKPQLTPHDLTYVVQITQLGTQDSSQTDPDLLFKLCFLAQLLFLFSKLYAGSNAIPSAW